MKNFFLKFRDIPKSTTGRTIALVLACLNQVIAIIGSSTFANALWYQIASIVVTVLISAWTAWENNDYTAFAKITTKILDAMEDGKITLEEAQALLDKAENQEDHDA